jgi:hypothetical protein
MLDEQCLILVLIITPVSDLILIVNLDQDLAGDPFIAQSVFYSWHRFFLVNVVLSTGNDPVSLDYQSSALPLS